MSAEPLLFVVGAVHLRVALPVFGVVEPEEPEEPDEPEEPEEPEDVEEPDVEEVVDEAEVLVAGGGGDDATAELALPVPDPPQPERHSKTAAMPQAAFTDPMDVSSHQLILE